MSFGGNLTLSLASLTTSRLTSKPWVMLTDDTDSFRMRSRHSSIHPLIIQTNNRHKQWLCRCVQLHVSPVWNVWELWCVSASHTSVPFREREREASRPAAADPCSVPHYSPLSIDHLVFCLYTQSFPLSHTHLKGAGTHSWGFIDLRTQPQTNTESCG